MHTFLKNNNFYDPENLHLVHHVNQALRANHMFEKGKDYIVKDGILKIIDELTGRILEGRRFGDGLHQALEAKEQINIQAVGPLIEISSFIEIKVASLSVSFLKSKTSFKKENNEKNNPLAFLEID